MMEEVSENAQEEGKKKEGEKQFIPDCVGFGESADFWD